MKSLIGAILVAALVASAYAELISQNTGADIRETESVTIVLRIIRPAGVAKDKKPLTYYFNEETEEWLVTFLSEGFFNVDPRQNPEYSSGKFRLYWCDSDVGKNDAVDHPKCLLESEVSINPNPERPES